MKFFTDFKEKLNGAFAFSNPRQSANTALNILERRRQQRRLRSRPVVVQVEVTSRCNLNCFICSRSSTPFIGKNLNKELIEPVVDLSKYSRELVLFGYGEPLIAKPFYQLLAKAKSGRISFVTNGLALNPRITQKILATSRRPIYSISFSIDGASPDTYNSIREKSDFERVWTNLTELSKQLKNRSYPKLWIDFVIMKRNAAELPQLVRKAAGLGVDRINVFNIVVWDRAHTDESLIWYPDLAAKSFASARAEAQEANIRLDLPVIPDKNKSQPNTQAKFCHDPWSYTYIRQDGTVQACCFTDKFYMGNLKEQSFEAIWNNKAYQTLRTSVNSSNPPVVCRHCEQRWREVNSNDDNSIYLKLRPKNLV